MNARFFSIDEANAELPRLRILLAELQTARRIVMDARPELLPVLEKSTGNGGSHKAGEMIAEFERIERALQAVQETGCHLKDIEQGLIDFLHRQPSGREVYLCWRLGEDKIRYWHDLQTGVAGRQPLPE